ncbi:MAG TPA: SDR family oxidoreductase [Alphaproteobacteria bacterium]|nr:SDR family oxidoreductase [Alphaproteobacteria bacterium]
MTPPVILITGALTGIGRATALAYARQGAGIVASGRWPDAGATLVAELKGTGAADAVFVRADVRNEEEVGAMVDHAVEHFGRLDIAVNNAGKGILGPIGEVTPEFYADLFDTNVLGLLLCLKHEFRVMEPQGKGSIVNISSIFGHVGFRSSGGSVYSGSKHAVEGITRSVALEGAAKGIRVNAVAPGPIETEMFERAVGPAAHRARFIGMIPQKRAGTPEEAANLIVFLASDKSPFVTGEIVSIDGGYSAA